MHLLEMPKQQRHQKQQPANAGLTKSTSDAKEEVSSTKSSGNIEDFDAKNARAKELIMSTLVPGSEPWKIAEPLELASDIWKALEARYTQKDGQKNTTDTTMDSQKLAEIKFQAGTQTETREDELDPEVVRKREAMARATEEFHTSMPNRDQRFLWALLHGGKEETNAWFYGAIDPA